jgi:hypothetical protein
MINNLKTTEEIADILQCLVGTVFKIAEHCLPNKPICANEPTYWNEEEVNVILAWTGVQFPKEVNSPTPEIQKSKLFTTKEVAEALGCNMATLTENAKVYFPKKVIENGKSTYWTEAEVAVLLEFMKNHQSNQSNLSSQLNKIETPQTPAIKIAIAYKEIEALRMQVESILKDENIRLTQRNEDLCMENANVTNTNNALTSKVQTLTIKEKSREEIDKARHSRKELRKTYSKIIREFAMRNNLPYQMVFSQCLRRYNELNFRSITSVRDVKDNTEALIELIEIANLVCCH